MDIEFLDCDYEWVDLDALAASERETECAVPAGEPEYMAWFTSPAGDARAQVIA